MRKSLLFLAVGLLTCVAASAQRRYQGRTGAGYSVGVGAYRTNYAHVETVHGVRLFSCLFAGVGGGLNYHTDQSTLNGYLFGNVRGHLFDKPVSPFLSVDLGYGFYKGGGGLYTSPGVGVNFRVSKRYGLAFVTGLQTLDVGDRKVAWTNKNIFFRLEFTY